MAEKRFVSKHAPSMSKDEIARAITDTIYAAYSNRYGLFDVKGTDRRLTNERCQEFVDDLDYISKQYAGDEEEPNQHIKLIRKFAKKYLGYQYDERLDRIEELEENLGINPDVMELAILLDGGEKDELDLVDEFLNQYGQDDLERREDEPWIGSWLAVIKEGVDKGFFKRNGNRISLTERGQTLADIVNGKIPMPTSLEDWLEKVHPVRNRRA